MTNEFLVTYFSEGTLYDVKFVFPKDSITVDNIVPIPVINKKGVLPQPN